MLISMYAVQVLRLDGAWSGKTHSIYTMLEAAVSTPHIEVPSPALVARFAAHIIHVLHASHSSRVPTGLNTGWAPR